METYEVIVDEDSQRWYQNDKRHRLDGPAIILTNGDKSWWKKGKRHRLDGPAVMYSCGSENGDGNHYFIDGEEYTEQEFLKKTQKTVTITVSQETADMLRNQLGEL